jgi:hypothetical protein
MQKKLEILVARVIELEEIVTIVALIYREKSINCKFIASVYTEAKLYFSVK